MYFISYDEKTTLGNLIQELFPHVPFHFIEYEINKRNEKLISIFAYVRESRLKFCLGRKGQYIESVNDIIHHILDPIITVYIRSIDV